MFIYPLISEYVEAIKSTENNFEQLKHLRPISDEDGNPVMSVGNFAVVFKMKDERDGKHYAVKCFTREQEGRAESYKLIADELEFVSSNYLTPIKYLENELFVDTKSSDEEEFPVLLMDWVEGVTLDKYIRANKNDMYALGMLAYQFSKIASWLLSQPFAHGDLKPDNILVREDGTLVLVDYDGMYVPAMKGQKAREIGSPDYRHPARTEKDFDEHIDDFSLVLILLSLKAISLNPHLLEESDTDCMLFSEKDFRALGGCERLSLLLRLNDVDMNRLLGLLLLAFSEGNLSNVSFKLLCVTKPQRDDSHFSRTTKKECTTTESEQEVLSVLHKVLNNQDAFFYYNGAAYYYRQGDSATALDFINRAIELGDDDMKELATKRRSFILANQMI